MCAVNVDSRPRGNDTLVRWTKKRLGETMALTGKERIKRAVAHEEIDCCPYVLWLDGGSRQKLVEFTGDENFCSKIESFMDGVGPGYPGGHERVDDNHYRDEFGVIWEDTFDGEIGMVRDPILKEPSLKGYEFPKTRIPGLFDCVSEQLPKVSHLYLSWSIGFCLYERAWTLRGIESLLSDMLEHPDFVDELLDRICEFNLDLIDQACEHPIDCVRFGDDWGAQHGLIMGPGFWRRFIKPHFARLVERVKSHGKDTFLHCDGDIREIIPDLVDIGLDILNPVQPDVMDIYEIKREFGKDLAFCGGVSVQHLLPRCSAQEVRTEVRRLIREIGAGGGFIIAPTHTLGNDIPIENLAVLVEEVTNQQ